MKKTLLALLAGMALLLAGTVTLQAAPVNVIFVVDESGSMSGEHAWLAGMINSLDAGLVSAGITTRSYGLVGFGSSNPAPRLLGGGWMTAAQFATATGSLVVNGGTEDGYAGINFGFTNASLTPDAGAALNVVLVTDEDRDNYNGNALTYASTLASFTQRKALLNAVVNNGFSCSGTALGIDSANTAYKADGTGGFTTCSPGTIGSGFGSTNADYIQLALATGGAAWDLNQLRAGGLTATSFTNSFVEIKVEEIKEQIVPEPGTYAMLGTGLLGLALIRLRKRA
jgi:hypothetical protein